MQDENTGATKDEQIVHHATALVSVRDRRRAAKAANNQAEYEAAKKAEYVQGLELDKAVKRNRPP
jgi:hypothetical protein